MADVDREIIAALDEEREYANSQARYSNRLQLDRGDTVLVRFLPVQMGRRKQWYLRVGRHWINRRPYFCKQVSSIDAGGDPNYACPLCDMCEQHMQNTDDDISNAAFRASANAQWMLYCIVWQRGERGHDPSPVPRSELYVPYEIWLTRDAWLELSAIFKRSLRPQGSVLSILDPNHGSDIWINKDKRGVLHFQKNDPQPIADKDAEQLMEKIVAKVRIQEFRAITGEKMEDALDKLEDAILRPSRRRDRDDDDRGGRGRGDDDRRLGGRGRPAEDDQGGYDDRGRGDDRRGEDRGQDRSRGEDRRGEREERGGDRRDDRRGGDGERTERRDTGAESRGEPRGESRSESRGEPRGESRGEYRGRGGDDDRGRGDGRDRVERDGRGRPLDPIHDDEGRGGEGEPEPGEGDEPPPAVHASPPPSMGRRGPLPAAPARGRIAEDPEEVPPERRDPAPPASDGSEKKTRLSDAVRKGMRNIAGAAGESELGGTDDSALPPPRQTDR
jgi:hypothetical protein